MFKGALGFAGELSRGDLSRRSFSEDGRGQYVCGGGGVDEIAAARRSKIVPERHNEIHACA